MLSFEFEADVELWNATSSWHFAVLPEDLGRDIKQLTTGLAGGWGSLKVDVRIGNARWSTSIFPDKRRGTYLLPLKAAVRKQEQISPGDTVTVELMIAGT
jgi:hypothetical protein